VNPRKEVNKSFQSLSSLQVRSSLLSKNCPSLPLLASRDNNMKPAQRASPKVTGVDESVLSRGEMKGCLQVPLGITPSDTCESEGVLPFGRTGPQSVFSGQTSSKTSSHLRLRLPPLTSDSEASKKPFSPIFGFSDFRSGAVEPVARRSFKTLSDSANSGRQPTKIHPLPKRTRPVLPRETRPPPSTDVTAECRGKSALKTPLQSLFASPIADALQPGGGSVPRCSAPPGFTPSSRPAPPPAGCGSDRVQRAGQPVEAPAGSFLGLFAAPLGAAPPPRSLRSQPGDSRTSSCSSHRSADDASHSSDSKPSTSDSETPPQRQVTAAEEIDRATGSSRFSPHPQMETDDVKKPSKQLLKKPPKQLLKKPPKHLLTPCSRGPPSETSTSPTPAAQAHRQLPDKGPDMLPPAHEHRWDILTDMCCSRLVVFDLQKPTLHLQS